MTNPTLPHIGTAIEPQVIETPRLLIRAVTPDMYKIIFETYSDEDIITFMGFKSVEEMEERKRNWASGMTTYRTSFRMFFMVSKETGKVIGNVGLHNWYALHQRSEIGYNMINEDDKNKGYMKEAVKAVIRYGFTEMGLNRIEALIAPFNTPSLKVVKGLGFTEEGTLRSHYLVNGKLEDSVLFSLLKSEYEAQG